MTEERCFSCEEPVGGGDFCYGCRKHVCDKCDVSAGSLSGSHTPDDHLIVPEEEIDE